MQQSRSGSHLLLKGCRNKPFQLSQAVVNSIPPPLFNYLCGHNGGGWSIEEAITPYSALLGTPSKVILLTSVYHTGLGNAHSTPVGILHSSKPSNVCQFLSHYHKTQYPDHVMHVYQTKGRANGTHTCATSYIRYTTSDTNIQPDLFKYIDLCIWGTQ